MQIRIGYELVYACPQTTPMILTLKVHPSRATDVIVPDHVRTDPFVPVSDELDSFGNWRSRFVAPAGTFRIYSVGVVCDSGDPDHVIPRARQIPVEQLPPEVLLFLNGSRYCETDLLTATAWQLFARAPMGWGRVQAICDFVHSHVQFGYAFARPTKTAWEVYQERRGVCRDFAHLAIALCRAMNIPARYCTGYLGDIGVPPSDAPMDFSGWFEAFLDGRWHTFDARHNVPRIGRVLIARGRDAADVAISTVFGPSTLQRFRDRRGPSEPRPSRAGSRGRRAAVLVVSEPRLASNRRATSMRSARERDAREPEPRGVARPRAGAKRRPAGPRMS